LQILRKACHALERKLPDPTTCLETVSCWLELAEGIPTTRLNDCYIDAMQHKEAGDRTMLGGHEFYQAWLRIVHEERPIYADADPTGAVVTEDEYAAKVRDISRRAHAMGARR
jgi:hypothetical protein